MFSVPPNPAEVVERTVPLLPKVPLFTLKVNVLLFETVTPEPTFTSEFVAIIVSTAPLMLSAPVLPIPAPLTKFIGKPLDFVSCSSPVNMPRKAGQFTRDGARRLEHS